jgi:hypothetical protein
MEQILENLVALIFCSRHGSYPEVMTLKDDMPGLELDLKAGTWRYTESGCRPNSQPPKKIGESDYSAKDRSSGVIGIYDRTKDDHLTSVARDWHELQENKHRNWNNVD